MAGAVPALYAKFQQDHLSGDAARDRTRRPDPVERRALASLPDERRRIAFLAGELERHAADGGAVGRIVIPQIGASYVVVKGTDTEDLEERPRRLLRNELPRASAGTTAIAGHRTTYLAPFRHIDSLRPGNRILLYMPYAHFTYTVIGQRVVAPTDVRAAVDERRLHAARAVRLHAAVQRRQTPARVCAPDAHRARRRRARAGCRAADRSAISRSKRRGRARPARGSSPAVLETLQPQLLARARLAATRRARPRHLADPA